MAIVLKNDVLFLHVPKSGGNWLFHVLRAEGLMLGSISHKHATYDYVLEPTSRRNPKRPSPRTPWSRVTARRHLSSTPKILCVVRHPLSWYESWFKYQSANGWRTWGEDGNIRRWHPCAELNGIRSDDFMGFMRAVNARHPGFLTRLFGRYAQGAHTHVLRNEALAEEFLAFAGSVGWQVDRSRVTATQRIGESAELDLSWDPEVLEDTVALEKAIFVKYGYSPHRAA